MIIGRQRFPALSNGHVFLEPTADWCDARPQCMIQKLFSCDSIDNRITDNWYLLIKKIKRKTVVINMAIKRMLENKGHLLDVSYLQSCDVYW